MAIFRCTINKRLFNCSRLLTTYRAEIKNNFRSKLCSNLNNNFQQRRCCYTATAAAASAKHSLSNNASTIYSLSSGNIKCGVAVIRVSGPSAKLALRTLIDKPEYVPKERYALLKSFYHPETKDMIDRGLLLWFPGPASFTGEDSCEFQVHGSLAVIDAMIDALDKVPDLRLAQPGEFTKRAFYGGKLDLTEVEGLADLIHAETEAQRKQAVLQSTGTLSRLYDNWRKRLIHCAAHLEAYIDFAEDENIEDDVIIQLVKNLERVRAEITTHLSDQRRGELLRDGVRTAIIGAPNVGKSSFLNSLVRRKVSIVTAKAGTTRDIIESMHNFGGYPVVFADTAGLRTHTTDPIEQEGMSLAKEYVQGSNLILLLTDAKALLDRKIYNDKAVIEYTNAYLQELAVPESILQEKCVKLVVNKIDLLTDEEYARFNNITNALFISCHTERNFQILFNGLEQLLKDLCGTVDQPRITRARHRQQLERCIEHINIFLSKYTPDIYPDMAISAQKLRNAVRCIERITGHVSNEEMLDIIFKDFCIGK